MLTAEPDDRVISKSRLDGRHDCHRLRSGIDPQPRDRAAAKPAPQGLGMHGHHPAVRAIIPINSNNGKRVSACLRWQLQAVADAQLAVVGKRLANNDAALLISLKRLSRLAGQQLKTAPGDRPHRHSPELYRALFCSQFKTMANTDFRHLRQALDTLD